MIIGKSKDHGTKGDSPCLRFSDTTIQRLIVFILDKQIIEDFSSSLLLI